VSLYESPESWGRVSSENGQLARTAVKLAELPMDDQWEGVLAELTQPWPWGDDGQPIRVHTCTEVRHS
jgi:hypothetical protein